jgi:predicted nucleic acid-binding protein
MASSPTNKKTAVFVDSSVLFAGSLSAKGFARDLLLAGLTGQVALVLSSDVFEETERNLSRDYPRALAAFQQFKDAWSGAVIDPDPEAVQEIAERIARKDAPIVAAALAAGVDYLATYDRKHLLSEKVLIKSSYNLAVVTPEEVLAMIEDSSR